VKHSNAVAHTSRCITIWPTAAVKESVAQAREIYGLFDAAEVEIQYFEGRHLISSQRAYDFLRENLS